MYVQITTRCNMLCEHCGFACTAEGQDMSWETFKQVIDHAVKNGHDGIDIGGGEPTVHPLFWQMLTYARARLPFVWLATNGKITETALTLACLGKQEIGISVVLSQDRFHEAIDPEVVEAFSSEHANTWQVTTRNVEDRIVGSGRALENNLHVSGKERDCICPVGDYGGFVTTDGTIKWCGCKDAKVVGHVSKGYTSKLWKSFDYSGMGCWRYVHNKMEFNRKIKEQRKAAEHGTQLPVASLNLV